MTNEYHKREDRESKLVMVGIVLFFFWISAFSISLDYLDESLLKFLILISALITNYIKFGKVETDIKNDYINLLYYPFFLVFWICSSFGAIGIIIYSIL